MSPKVPHILVIIRDSAIREAFCCILEKLGCEVLSTDLPDNAIQDLERDLRPDVILSEITLAGMGSNEFYRRLEAHEEWKKIPIVSYTPFLQYRLIEIQDILQTNYLRDKARMRSLNGMELAASEAMEILRRIPGEIILYIAMALEKKNLTLPQPFKIAASILREHISGK